MNCTYNFGNKAGYEDGVVCLPPGGEVTVTPTVEFYTTATTIPDPAPYVTPRFTYAERLGLGGWGYIAKATTKAAACPKERVKSASAFAPALSNSHCMP